MLRKLFLCFAILAAINQSVALKCYICQQACKVSDAESRTCGAVIGPSQEAFCTTQVMASYANSKQAIRKCEVVTKGHDIQCPDNMECTKCNNDLCNDSSSASAIQFTAISAMIIAFLVNKYLL